MCTVLQCVANTNFSFLKVLHPRSWTFFVSNDFGFRILFWFFFGFNARAKRLTKIILDVAHFVYVQYVGARPIEFSLLLSVFGVNMRGGGLGSSTISKNLMSPTPRRKWYLTTGRRAH